MPDRPLTIATYAAGASFAAIALVYVFGPTFFFDHDPAYGSRSARKKGVVGLVNPANDCFINSILQALAGLPELRAYLIREMHRRTLDGPDVYNEIPTAWEEEQKKRTSGKPVPKWVTIGLQQGLVTAGLKEMLDALNERPIYKKTISAQAFIRAVEHAFNTRISRSQQDAHEFLQVIVERLADEHSAGQRARRNRPGQEINAEHALPAIDNAGSQIQTLTDITDPPLSNGFDEATTVPDDAKPPESGMALPNPDITDVEDVFPMEGKLESQVECSVCHFKPKPSISSFLALTLNVPHNESSTTLNTCFDGMFKMEHIDDFRCDRCRLEHALRRNELQLSRAAPGSQEHSALMSDRQKIERALHEDPEKPPTDVELPDLSSAPKRRISRHTRISAFPKLLVLHLSRSIWDPHSVTSKNQAKVAFPETLALGGLLDRKTYRLLGVVTHKGGHNSGHYESFRRQVLAPPFSTPASMGTEGIYSLRGSPVPSAGSSPRLRSTPIAGEEPSVVDVPTAVARKSSPPRPFDAIPAPGLPDLPTASGTADSLAPSRRLSLRSGERRSLQRRRKRAQNQLLQYQQQLDRWWRISDEKVKECKTSEVLGMQKEVYLLFYEIIPMEGLKS